MDPEFKALLIRAPHSHTLADPTSSHPLALPGGASTAATATGVGTPQNGTYFRIVCNTDATICFGDAAVPAADASDWPLAAGVPQDFFLTSSDTHFCVYSAAAGSAEWYRG